LENSIENSKNKIHLISNIIKITLEKIEILLSHDAINNNEEVFIQLKSILIENLFKKIHTEKEKEENLININDIFFTESYLFLMKFCIKNFELKISSMKNLLEKTFNEYLFNAEILKIGFSDFKLTKILKEYLNLFWDYNTLIKNFNNDEILQKIFFKISKINKDYDLSLFIKLIIENLFNVNFFLFFYFKFFRKPNFFRIN